eukprot:UN33520
MVGTYYFSDYLLSSAYAKHELWRGRVCEIRAHVRSSRTKGDVPEGQWKMVNRNRTLRWPCVIRIGDQIDFTYKLDIRGGLDVWYHIQFSFHVETNNDKWVEVARVNSNEFKVRSKPTRKALEKKRKTKRSSVQRIL